MPNDVLPKQIASWTIKLYAECPHCNAYLDLYEVVDNYWEVLPEPGISDKELEIEITCPDCDEKFVVDETQY